MKPVQTDTANRVMKGSGDVQDLPITRIEYEDGVGLESCWELSDEEIQQIIETKRIHILVLGNWHPPILPKVKPEIEE
ncbi:hypothetical protein [Paenibacillus sinopodophylli]|uniref:hypothetical protein n=1 Tax=Paenibacillus sinopodophylli TaxID=1837342 RepID=UPI00110CB8E9|nr:hypothetical protein [Paenibacillus sinopodophylli]